MLLQLRRRYVEMARRLRETRLAQNRSLRDVAGKFGVQASMVMEWEKGETIPNAAYFVAWIEALGLRLDITDAEEQS